MLASWGPGYGTPGKVLHPTLPNDRVTMAHNNARTQYKMITIAASYSGRSTGNLIYFKLHILYFPVFLPLCDAAIVIIVYCVRAF